MHSPLLTSLTYFSPSHLACSDLHRSASQSDPVHVRHPETSCLHSYCHPAKPDQLETLLEIPRVMVGSSSLLIYYGSPRRTPRILHWSCDAGVSLCWRNSEFRWRVDTTWGPIKHKKTYTVNPAFRTPWCIMFINRWVLEIVNRTCILNWFTPFRINHQFTLFLTHDIPIPHCCQGNPRNKAALAVHLSLLHVSFIGTPITPGSKLCHFTSGG